MCGGVWRVGVRCVEVCGGVWRVGVRVGGVEASVCGRRETMYGGMVVHIM